MIRSAKKSTSSRLCRGVKAEGGKKEEVVAVKEEEEEEEDVSGDRVSE